MFNLCRNIIILCSIGIFTACTPVNNNSSAKQKGDLISVPSKIKDKIGPYEIQDIASSNLETLKKQPTLFDVGSVESKASFDRMIFFFENYTSGYKPQNVYSEMKSMVVQSANQADSVLYRVQRQIQGFNIRYTVSAADRKKPADSAILAANFARFIRDGQLDMKLIKGK